MKTIDMFVFVRTYGKHSSYGAVMKYKEHVKELTNILPNTNTKDASTKALNEVLGTLKEPCIINLMISRPNEIREIVCSNCGQNQIEIKPINGINNLFRKSVCLADMEFAKNKQYMPYNQR